jgi:hypothetical protein
MLIWVSHIQPNPYFLYLILPPIKGILSVSNIICILNGVINKKIKTQTKETVFPE